MEQIVAKIAVESQTARLRDLRETARQQLLAAPYRDDALYWNEQVNRLHDGLIGQTIRLAEQEMLNRGEGSPPVPYAFVLFGSGGRQEQTLWSDQDNGIVYEDGEGDAADSAAVYFCRLAEEIARRLQELGYPPCEGSVLCTNPQWNMPLSAWIRTLSGWLAEPDWEHMRYALIFADVRTVYGSTVLGERLKRFFYDAIKDDRQLLAPLLQNTLHRKVALGVFGQLITERYGTFAGGIDLKYGAYLPMVNAIRLLSIKENILFSPTVRRICELKAGNCIPGELAEDWLHAFAVLIRLRSLTACRMEGETFVSSGKLSPDALTPALKRELKLCLHIGQRLQKFVKHQMLQQEP